jgi:iron complex outermembrane recepter protein
MNCNVIRSALALGAALGLLQAEPAVAQATAADQSGGPGQSTGTQAPARTTDSGLSEIIVTARRVEERAQDVPISITVFNQEELTNRNIVNAQDLAAYTPSLSANSNFGSQNSSFAIRGFVQDSGTQPSVGVYFADVVAPRGASNNVTVGDGAGPGSFFDLQNVQVLKGPQGTLFGRNTTGGAILIVPQKPTAKLEGYAEVSFGDYGMKRIQAVANLPVSDVVRFRIGVDHQSRDGYEDNYTGIGPSRLNDVDYTAVRASLVVDVTPDLENYSILSYSLSDTAGEVQKVIGCDPSPSATNLLGSLACAQLAQEQAQGAGFYTVASTIPDPDTRLQTWQIINTTTWHTSDTLTIKDIISYAQLSEKYNSALFGTNFHLIFPPVIPAPGLPIDFATISPAPGLTTADESTATEELQFQGHTTNDLLSWQAGAYLENVEPLALVGNQNPILLDCTNAATFNCLNPLGVGTMNYTAGKTYFNNVGLYEQSTYSLTDTLKLTEGLRYTWDRTHNNSSVITYAVPSPGVKIPSCTNPDLSLPNCDLHYQESSSAPTWLIDLDYKPADDILTYGKYSRGYRAGGVSAQSPTEFSTFKPEKVDTYEIGAKTSFSAVMRGTFNVAAFYNDFTNQQLQLNLNPKPPPTVGPASGILNAGKSTIYGVELETSLIPFERFTLDVNYTYLGTRIDKVTLAQTPPSSPYIAASPIAVGDPLALSPKNKVTVTGTYTLPLPSDIGSVSAGATFTHTGSMITNYVDSSAQNPAIVPLGTLPALNLLNLNLNWNSVAGTAADVAFFVTNVTDRQYYTYVPGLYGTVGFETAGLGTPRMYGVRVRYSFGK